jgi:hypothetical protein
MFSTLPEQFWKQHGVRTLIHESYVPRNQEIYDVVWGSNPFVLGRSERRANAGKKIRYSNVAGSFIGSWEALHGLQPLSDKPKIYLKNYQTKHTETVLVDFSALSIRNSKFMHNPSEAKKYVQNRVDLETDKKFLAVVFANPKIASSVISDAHLLEDIMETREVHSLRDYIDLQLTSSELIAFHSGSIALGNALQAYKNNLRLTCLLSQMLSTSKRQKVDLVHNYQQVEYVVI